MRRKLRLSLGYAKIFPNQNFNICCRDRRVLLEVSTHWGIIFLKIAKAEQALFDSLQYASFKNLGSYSSSLTGSL